MDAVTTADAWATVTMAVDATAGFGLLSCFSSATITMDADVTAIAIATTADVDAATAFSAETTTAAGLSGFS